MDLTPVERKILVTLLEELSDMLANETCNDYILPNTPENLELVQAAEEDTPCVSDDGSEIYATNFVILDYLIGKIRGE